jgi:hypothetical protein
MIGRLSAISKGIMEMPLFIATITRSLFEQPSNIRAQKQSVKLASYDERLLAAGFLGISEWSASQ